MNINYFNILHFILLSLSLSLSLFLFLSLSLFLSVVYAEAVQTRWGINKKSSCRLGKKARCKFVYLKSRDRGPLESHFHALSLTLAEDLKTSVSFLRVERSGRIEREIQLREIQLGTVPKFRQDPAAKAFPRRVRAKLKRQSRR